MEITRADLREYIQNIKKTLGWTYDQLAEAIGINPNSLRNYTKNSFPRTQEQAWELVQRIRRAAAEEQRRRRGLSA
ncbi:hypothetical protein [Staphylospora marina]|uniref:hypothetical protein n=1 Tax=Staphylospora marina TaxID=2490858 RepID=UPI000F5BA39C|nr:hypothetical protein [Staphylospora marina]